MKSLLEKYGSYVVEPGTILFRRAPTTDYFESMFFGFDIYGTSASGLFTSEVQQWKVVRPIQSLFMVKGVTKGKKVRSAIVEVYNSFFPSDPKESRDDVHLKRYECPERAILFQKLCENNIYSWTTSVEDKISMELCLFGSTILNQSQVRFMSIIPKDKNYYESFDSFRRSALNHLPALSA
jgi:hypothetical protein